MCIYNNATQTYKHLIHLCMCFSWQSKIQRSCHCPAVVTSHYGRKRVIKGQADAKWGFRIFTLKMSFLWPCECAYGTPMHTWAQTCPSMLFYAKSVSFLVSQRLACISQNECTSDCCAPPPTPTRRQTFLLGTSGFFLCGTLRPFL